MKRTLSLLVLGVAIGGGALYLARDPHTSTGVLRDGDRAVRAEAPVSATPDGETLQRDLIRLVGGTFGLDERAAVERLVEGASRVEVEALARTMAGLPRIAGTRFALEALLARYGRPDPRAAIELGRQLDVPAEMLAKLHREWGRVDLDAALRALESYPEPLAALVAVELADEVGGDAAGLERVLAAVPRRKAAFARVAAGAVKDDARGALLRASRFADAEIRAGFAAALLREWARTDAETMLGYVEGLDVAAQRDALAVGGLEAFAQLPPARMLEIARRLPADATQEVRRIALMGLARTEPLAAIQYAETLPPGPEREQSLDLAARGYAEADPQAALAWAQSLQPPVPSIVASVVAGFARVDPERAIELLIDVVGSTRTSNQRHELLRSLVASGELGAEQTALLASRWAGTARSRAELDTITGAWARSDPIHALEWLLANRDRASRNSFAEAAQSLGRKAAAGADPNVSGIPSDLRPLWIKSAADGYALADPGAAATWVARYQGQEGYADAVATVARRTARSDPPAAAALLATVDAAGTAEGVGATDAIATRWSRSDAPAARAWALGLAPGEVRDAALAPVLGVLVARTGAVEPAVLQAFSSDSAQQQALARAVSALAERDAASARVVADQYLTSPELRRQAERLLGGR